MSTEPTTLAEFMKDARHRHRYSIRELAEKASITSSTISRIEAGANSPRATTLGSLLRVLRLSEADLLTFAKLAESGTQIALKASILQLVPIAPGERPAHAVICEVLRLLPAHRSFHEHYRHRMWQQVANCRRGQ